MERNDNMKKKVKILILFLFPLFLSGCTIQYNLKINEDLSVEENIITKIDYEYFDHMEKNPVYAKKYVDTMMRDYNTNYVYSWNYLEEKETYGVKMYRKHQSIEELTNAESIKFFYEGIGIERNSNYITLKTIGTINMGLIYTYAEREPEEDDDYTYIMRPVDTYFSITVPFQVTAHNADKVNKESNTYYWLITEQTKNKSIEITFNQNKKHFSILKVVKSFPYKFLLFPLIIAIIIVLGKKIVEISRINNEI